MMLNTICLKIGNKRVPFTILQGIRAVFFPNVALSHGPMDQPFLHVISSTYVKTNFVWHAV